MPLAGFHPAVATWFDRTFGEPTPPQVEGWPAIREGKHTLIASPTGSGKTLAAFLCAIDGLVRQGLEEGLPERVQILYVSPLKALSNDIEHNLQAPLEGIRGTLEELGFGDVDIRTAVRTGDTPSHLRTKMVKSPPHIFVTTPESLYILLTSEGGRRMLSDVKTVIVDEIHAVVSNKRGSHLSLSLERLQELVGRDITRIGLSATQNPIEQVAHFLVGANQCATDDDEPACRIVDVGHQREMDVAVEIPGSPLETVMSLEVWDEIYQRLAALVEAHNTTLIFVNTRRLAERVTRHLGELLGEDAVTSHHGSLARKHRLEAERRLKSGELQAVVATASLELGIDVGDVDLVCQLGSPHSVATFLQRVGRSGHWHGGTPKGRLFPLSRDDLVECAALMRCVQRRELDRIEIPEGPLDILAQQIVASAAAKEEWSEDALLAMVRRAWPYRTIDEETFGQVVRVLSDGFATNRGRRGAFLHRDEVNGRIRPRRSARLTAITNGGAIPDTFDYEVRLEPEGLRVGTLNEDFAIESMSGDIFQLGNVSYEILRVEPGVVRVADARGKPPSLPFWFGEAPSRADLLSTSVNAVREGVEARNHELATVVDWLQHETAIGESASRQVAEYLLASRTALGTMPTRNTIILERFFDETGAMHLVVHAPFGSRINRAWGLSLRKRFCRSFNVELQAAATEDAIVLSLGPTHSFPLEDVFRFLRADNVRDVLIQAMLDAPMFQTRWRWNATRALAILRFRGGKKVPPPFQRMQADDLLALCFPDQVACLENVAGDREIPDHPLVHQTIEDCLHEAMDIEGLEALLERLQAGELTLLARDLTEPSPLAQEILNAKPYAFLDDAPLEERRTQAVMSRRWLDPSQASDLGALDRAAIDRVRGEAWPEPRDPDELHDALLMHNCFTDDEAGTGEWHGWLRDLTASGRSTRFIAGERALWTAAERLPLVQAAWPDGSSSSDVMVPERYRLEAWTRDEAVREVVRGRLQASGPVRAGSLARLLGLEPDLVDAALAALESEGFVLRGMFSPESTETEWCERGLLARIHRYTLKRLRKEIEAVTAADFIRFLLSWQHAAPDTRMDGPEGLAVLVEQLEGLEAGAAAWESDILPVRMEGYDPSWLDSLCISGRVTWSRRTPPMGRASSPIRTSPVAFSRREHARTWRFRPVSEEPTSSNATTTLEMMRRAGASFFDDIVRETGLLPTQTEEALGELVSLGLVTADGFTGLRALLAPDPKRRRRGRRAAAAYSMEAAGRWTVLPDVPEDHDVESVAWTLLRRWGVVFRRLLDREGDLPPWYALLRVYRRLEAQGRIRGGRFVAGFAGEQYALPEAVTALRKSRRKPKSGELMSISAADPLNLVGILTPGHRVPSTPKNRILFRDGVPIAFHEGSETHFLEDPEDDRWSLTQALRRQPVPRAVQAYLGSRP
ncbi:MAG: DEAD/DEAH box helicase [Myxococcales bacterium]|nr:DEAD/DEAH box helicase [Myxococcales bacterium]MDH3483998.1 DEAD/DEAH box helicase [Myxococcales bacterium]